MTANNYNNPFRELSLLVSLGIVAIALLLMLTGCKTTEEGAIRKVAKVAHRQPQVLSRYCADKYPVIPTIIDSTREYRDTTYIPGETVFVDCDSAIDANNKAGNPAGNKKVACPPCADTMKYHESINRYQKIIQENNAKTDTYAKENSILKEDNAVLKDKVKSKDNLLWWFGIIGGIAVLGWGVWLVLKFFK